MRISSDGIGQQPEAMARQKHGRLVDAAQQFEATMLQELLKPMQRGQDGWDEKSDDSASSTISSFGSEAMAKALAMGGGFGIAKQIVAKVALEDQRHPEKKSSGTKVS